MLLLIIRHDYEDFRHRSGGGAASSKFDATYSTSILQKHFDSLHRSSSEKIVRNAGWHEWEWENSPEVSLVIVESTEHAIDLFNNHSPQFIASLISENESEHKQFFESVNAPFVGNGFTRWVDGQYALGRPELGLSNWQFGRLFGRGGVLSGDSVVTTRTKNIQTDPNVTRIS